MSQDRVQTALHCTIKPFVLSDRGILMILKSYTESEWCETNILRYVISQSACLARERETNGIEYLTVCKHKPLINAQ